MPRLIEPPPPPAGMSEAAAAEWRELARPYAETFKLEAADLPLLRMLAEALADERQARRTIEAEGLTIAAGSGGRKGNPALRQAEAARALAVRLLLAFAAAFEDRALPYDPAHPLHRLSPPEFQPAPAEPEAKRADPKPPRARTRKPG